MILRRMMWKGFSCGLILRSLLIRNVCEVIEEGNDEGVTERMVKIVSKIKKKRKMIRIRRKVELNMMLMHGSINKEERTRGKEGIELLKKEREKFPKGTPRRWEAVSGYIGTGKSVEEVVKAMKTVVERKPDDNKAFDSFLEKRKPSKSIDSPLTTRIKVEGDRYQCLQLVRVLARVLLLANDQKSESGTASTSSEQDDVWSVEEERAMIRAMKTLPKELSGGARWE